MAADTGARLAGLRVLIPRPQRAQDTLVEQLRALGCQPLLLPVVEIQPVISPPLLARLPGILAGADVVIFISSNAVDCCFDLLAQTGAELPQRATCLAVGRTTAEALAAHGYAAAYPLAKADSEGLLELEQLRQPAGLRVVICRGEGGRDRLRDELRARGAEVTYLDLYRRQPSRRHAGEINALIQADGIDAIVVHSGAILAGLMDCLEGQSPDRIRQLRFLVPGQRVADLVVDWGVSRPIVAANALPDAMVTALVDCYTGAIPNRPANPTPSAESPVEAQGNTQGQGS